MHAFFSVNLFIIELGIGGNNFYICILYRPTLLSLLKKTTQLINLITLPIFIVRLPEDCRSTPVLCIGQVATV